MTPADAQDALEDEGFAVNIVERRSLSCSPVPEGELIRQRPRPGTMVPEGSEVTLVVSTGPVLGGPGGIIAGILSTIGGVFFWDIFCPPPPTQLNK